MDLKNTLIDLNGLDKKQIRKVMSRLHCLGVYIEYLLKIKRKGANYIYISKGLLAAWKVATLNPFGKPQVYSYQEFIKIPITIHSSPRLPHEKAWILFRTVEWTQGAGARNEEGNVENIFSEKAVSFCMIGALQRVENPGSIAYNKGYEEFFNKRKKLADHLKAKYRLGTFNSDLGGIATWNDHPDRTKKEVIAVLKELNL